MQLGFWYILVKLIQLRNLHANMLSDYCLGYLMQAFLKQFSMCIGLPKGPINGNHGFFVSCKGLGNLTDSYNQITYKQYTKKKEVE